MKNTLKIYCFHVFTLVMISSNVSVFISGLDWSINCNPWGISLHMWKERMAGWIWMFSTTQISGSFKCSISEIFSFTLKCGWWCIGRHGIWSSSQWISRWLSWMRKCPPTQETNDRESLLFALLCSAPTCFRNAQQEQLKWMAVLLKWTKWIEEYVSSSWSQIAIPWERLRFADIWKILNSFAQFVFCFQWNKRNRMSKKEGRMVLMNVIYLNSFSRTLQSVILFHQPSVLGLHFIIIGGLVKTLYKPHFFLNPFFFIISLFKCFQRNHTKNDPRGPAESEEKPVWTWSSSPNRCSSSLSLIQLLRRRHHCYPCRLSSSSLSFLVNFSEFLYTHTPSSWFLPCSLFRYDPKKIYTIFSCSSSLSE